MATFLGEAAQQTKGLSRQITSHVTSLKTTSLLCLQQVLPDHCAFIWSTTRLHLKLRVLVHSHKAQVNCSVFQSTSTQWP